MISFILLVLIVQQTQFGTIAKKEGVAHKSRDNSHTTKYTSGPELNTVNAFNRSAQKTEFGFVDAGRSNHPPKHDPLSALVPKGDHKVPEHKPEAPKADHPVEAHPVVAHPAESHPADPHKSDAHKVDAPKPETPAEVPPVHVPALEGPTEGGPKASISNTDPLHAPTVVTPNELANLTAAEVPKPDTPAETPAEVPKLEIPALEAGPEGGPKASVPSTDSLHIPNLVPPHDINSTEAPNPQTPAETPAEVPKPAIPALEAPSEGGAKASIPHLEVQNPLAHENVTNPDAPKVDTPNPHPAAETPAEVPKPPVPALEAPSEGGAKAHIPDAHPNPDIPNPDSLKLGFDTSAVMTNTDVSKTVIDEYAQNVKFYLYDDPKNVGSVKILAIGQPDTLKHVTIPKKDGGLKILIHGFMQDIKSAFLQELKDALLNTHGNPVICIDWGHMADQKFGPDALKALFYPFIVNNIPTVGEYIGDFILFLKDHNVIDNFDQVHIIGFSLGAHVSGIAGGYLLQKTTEQLGRITGLDPSGPQFFLKSKERRLCFDDAKFVDIIHTSHLGYFMQLGHVDFFPNGGKFQPGCLETIGVVETVESLAAILAGSCAHARSWEYYMQSVKTNTMFACECNNIFKYEIDGCKAECDEKMPFGDLAPSTARGNYFLTVANNSHA